MRDKIYFSIDMKSFFAACECAELGLDPFKTALVVANTHQGEGAITLAITPYLKKLGVKSRCRVFEIPRNIRYKMVDPKMDLYTLYSDKIYDVYTSFFDSKDIHRYSIDECFIDVTSYLKYYNISCEKLASRVLTKLYESTNLHASCGIGSTIFLAKVAMDVYSKNNGAIAVIRRCDIKDKLYSIKDLSLIFGIGENTKNNLNSIGIYNAQDLINYDPLVMKNKLGVIGLDLINNFLGIETNTISSLNDAPKDKSIMHSKYLLRDFDKAEIYPVLLSMSRELHRRLLVNNYGFLTLNMRITLSKELNLTYHKSVKFDNYIVDSNVIYDTCKYILDCNGNNYSIRKIDIHLHHLKSVASLQRSLFDDYSNKSENSKIDSTISSLEAKYGKDIIKRATEYIDI